jgi:GT2 family glycosyltransferase
MTLSILIVNWNSKDYLRNCLNTVRSTCADLNPQIIVVDGGSFDGCEEMITAEFPEVEFIQIQENLGFGKSNNVGFERVTGKALLLLNPDTELTPGSISKLMEYLQKITNSGILGVRLHRSDGILQTNCVQRFPAPLIEFLSTDVFLKIFANANIWGTNQAFHSKDPIEVECVTGACMMMYSETFRKIGGFSPQFFMYGEDLDLCFKVKQLGLKIYHVPSVAIVHHGGGSSNESFSKFSTVLMRESVYLFIKNNRGMFSAIIYRILMAISSLIRILILISYYFFSIVFKPSLKNKSVNLIRKWYSVLKWSTGFQKR